jgi:uncharacterized damage-inducible protein DinB
MRSYLAARWTAIGNKLVDLAEAFPEEKYDARPSQGARTFAEQLSHVAYWNEYCRDVHEGKSPDGSANALPTGRYRNKRELVKLLRDGFAGVTSALSSPGASTDGASLEQAEAFIEHGCEHYGQLVVYCRLQGIVPPASREAN